MSTTGEPQPGVGSEAASAPNPSAEGEGMARKLSSDFPKIPPEVLKISTEKVLSYVGGKVTGLDGEPLSDEAADAAMSSVKLEGDARTQEILGQIASGEQVGQAEATDTLLLDLLAAGPPIKKLDMTDYLRRAREGKQKDAGAIAAIDGKMFPTPFEELMREGYHKIDDAKTSELRKGLADIIGGQTSSGQAPEAPPPPSVPTAPGLS